MSLTKNVVVNTVIFLARLSGNFSLAIFGSTKILGVFAERHPKLVTYLTQWF
jgi:hypothetical protein